MISRRLLRIKVLKSLYAHLTSESNSLMGSEKTLVASIDKTYDLYFQMMSLIVELARYAESRQEAAKQKKLPTFEDLNPNRKFVDNAVIRLIANSDAVNDYLAASKLSWANYPELIKTLFTQLEQTEYYQKYMASQESSWKEDMELVTAFYTNELEESEALEDVLDEQSILWNDDLGFALIMVTRTLSNMRASHTDIKVLPKFKSWEDLDFARELFEKAAVNYDSYLAEIENYTRNWDVERIAYMDNVIMVTAVAELLNCPSIPVKVTLDEYIEIAKFYSTPGSSTFINGILDKIVATFTAEGKIKKSGRGLIQ
ncbi:MAG: transcription antitermination factor NusB [Alistipes sp.]|nr:transcription antitermination factor NusB [Alistipes sp.]